MEGSLNVPARSSASHLHRISDVYKFATLSENPITANWGIWGWMHSLIGWNHIIWVGANNYREITQATHLFAESSIVKCAQFHALKFSSCNFSSRKATRGKRHSTTYSCSIFREPKTINGEEFTILPVKLEGKWYFAREVSEFVYLFYQRKARSIEDMLHHIRNQRQSREKCWDE